MSKKNPLGMNGTDQGDALHKFYVAKISKKDWDMVNQTSICEVLGKRNCVPAAMNAYINRKVFADCITRVRTVDFMT